MLVFFVIQRLNIRGEKKKKKKISQVQITVRTAVSIVDNYHSVKYSVPGPGSSHTWCDSFSEHSINLNSSNTRSDNTAQPGLLGEFSETDRHGCGGMGFSVSEEPHSWLNGWDWSRQIGKDQTYVCGQKERRKARGEEGE